MGDDLFYRALGDSLTLGVGNYFSGGFVSRYAQISLKTLRRPVRTEVFAKNKMTSGQLRAMLQDPHVRFRLIPANMITITTGGNDLLYANRMFLKTYNPIVFEHAEQQFYENLLYILHEIQLLKSLHSTPYFVRLIGLYNPYPDLSYSLFWVNRFNQILKNFATDIVQYVDILPHFDQGRKKLLAIGSMHPNKHGYNLIAHKLAETGYYPLV
ncbi:GDSL-type esterase/lipase family protein [Alkalibacillus aidingensis]|uniref:GDSL-type esterase/lipase family protein n=1 Tax=Alkalibacillus aidingensis TaxID=2747607 RepID=UPI0016607266|nr:GDSL-type esterase/lipase family protein [Alkalibacillus aidingensis]